MHPSAYKTGKQFFDIYTNDLENFIVVEIGSQNVNGGLRDHRPNNCISYIGLDFVPGLGVDVVLIDPYKYPLEDEMCDVVVTSSCLEHSEMFWLSFLEGLRILKPDGIMYCNAPSDIWWFHKYPVDCWRFYPDAAKGLMSWARYNGVNAAVLESFITPTRRVDGIPGPSDWAAVFIKDENYMNKFSNRIVDSLVEYEEFENGYRFPSNEKFPNGWDYPNAYHGEPINR